MSKDELEAHITARLSIVVKQLESYSEDDIRYPQLLLVESQLLTALAILRAAPRTSP